MQLAALVACMGGWIKGRRTDYTVRYNGRYWYTMYAQQLGKPSLSGGPNPVL